MPQQLGSSARSDKASATSIPSQDSKFSEFVRSLETTPFQLGDLLGDSLGEQSYSDPFQDSMGRDRSQSDCSSELYLVCQGRVRILSWSVQRQENISILVLEAGAIVGADPLFCKYPLPYKLVGASSGAVATLSPQSLTSFPQLRDALRQQTLQRQFLIFLKTQGRNRELITQVQSQSLSVQEIQVAAGTRLADLESEGMIWLRHGEISAPNRTVSIGDHWQHPSQDCNDWIATTDVTLYVLPSVDFDHTTVESLLAQTLVPPTQSSTTRTQHVEQGSANGIVNSIVNNTVNNTVNGRKQKRRATVIQFPKPAKPRYQHQRWRGFPFIRQQSATDCSVTCLAMIGRYWGARLSLNALREQAKVTRTGASLKNLAAAAEDIGFQARPVRASIDRLTEQKNPWIAHWQGDHYVVVYRTQGNRIVIADPARGTRSLPIEAFLTHWTGYALLLDPTDQLYSTEQEAPSLGRFSGLLWSYRSIMLQVLLVSLLIQVFGLVTPLLTQVILDRVITQKSLSMLNVFAIGLILFSAWRVGLIGIRQYLLDYFSNRIDLTLISGFIGHALRLPLKFFESRHVGDILTRVQENQKIQLFLVRQAISTWLDGSMAIVYLGLMFYYNIRLALLVVALIPPIVILTLVATPLLRRVSRDVFNETADQNSLLVEIMTGIATVKTAATEQEVRWRWEDRLTRMLNARFRGQKLANSLQILSGLINAIGSAALLWYGATLVIQEQLTIGQLVAFNMLLGSIITPILSVVGFWDELQEVVISVERLNDVLLAEPEEAIDRPMLVMPQIEGDVKFEHVSFRYEQTDDRYVLQNLSFQVQVGQTVAIVGRSGSGKSTLVKLLQGFYPPTNGRISIDGHDIQHVSPGSLRSQLGVVPQECFLFSGTVLENIQLFRSDYTLEQVIEVAKLAEAHSFIQELPLGYSTKVGERGANLSGGQRQRIAIARALLGDPAILILDEATSSLDTESERRFQQNLARISRDRTTFVIAHRLSTVRHADLILVLDQGILVEQGNHQTLSDRRGLYYHLTQQQINV
jgi:ATP-binding cassette subfamily B protein